MSDKNMAYIGVSFVLILVAGTAAQYCIVGNNWKTDKKDVDWDGNTPLVITENATVTLSKASLPLAVHVFAVGGGSGGDYGGGGSGYLMTGTLTLNTKMPAIEVTIGKGGDRYFDGEDTIVKTSGNKGKTLKARGGQVCGDGWSGGGGIGNVMGQNGGMGGKGGGHGSGQSWAYLGGAGDGTSLPSITGLVLGAGAAGIHSGTSGGGGGGVIVNKMEPKGGPRVHGGKGYGAGGGWNHDNTTKETGLPGIVILHVS